MTVHQILLTKGDVMNNCFAQLSCGITCEYVKFCFADLLFGVYHSIRHQILCVPFLLTGQVGNSRLFFCGYYS